MKRRTARGITHVCDDCGCQGYEREPNENEINEGNLSFWHCPNCGKDFVDYISFLD
ncbi:hypothetical protein SAMN05446037_100324 [Anaerovirgula multivorans]|uniref:Uncharacterized protein n=1 Tax=Anaerovirgula multivorans TaxID=312168 RepID=A0A239B5Q3_9FIRM|nr:hypothetical protein [Anaerovirgula multivorans]SNS03210.1 hypothetical protein SAMN05446037_100324 [Anaerovirgula multivorans]